MAEDQIIRLILDVIGPEKVAELRTKVAALKGTTEEAAPAMVKVEGASRQMAAGLSTVATAAAGAATTLKTTATATDDAKSKMGGLQNAIRGVGFGVSDVFANNGPIGSRIGGFANNITGIVTGIGAAMGKMGPQLLATAAVMEIGVTAIGASLSALGIKTVDDFLTVITGGVAKASGALKVLEDRIGELESRPHLIPVEILELQNARKEVEAIKSALQAVEALRKTQAGVEAESGKQVTTAIAESTTDAGKHLGAEAVTAKLRADLVTEMQAREDERARNEQGPIREQLEALEKLNEGGRDPGGEAMRVKLRTELAAAVKRATEARTAITTGADAETPALADKALGDILKAAQTGQGEAQKAGREALVRRTRAAGFGKLSEEIEEADPDTIRQQREGQEISERRQKAIEEQKAIDKKRADAREKEGKAAEKKKKEADDLVDMLNREGQKNQDLYFKGTGKAEDKEESAERKAEKQRLVKGVAAVNKQTGEDVAAISKHTTLDEEARVLAARGRAQGVPEQQILMAVSSGIRQALARNGMDRGRAFGAANQMATGALKDVDLAAAGQGRDAAALGAFNHLLGAVHDLAAQQQSSQQQWMQAAGMASQARAATQRLRGGR